MLIEKLPTFHSRAYLHLKHQAVQESRSTRK